MIPLIRSEWIKFRSVRSTWVTLILAGALVVLVALIAANENNKTIDRCGPAADVAVEATSSCAGEAANLSGLTAGVAISSLLFGVLGVQVIGQEHRFSTIRSTFTAVPRRLRVLLAKLIVVSGACALVAAAMTAFCFFIGTSMVDGFELDGTDRRIAWGIVLFSALWSAAGLAVGTIVRQPIAGILVLLGESLVAENVIGGLWNWTYEWLPFVNGFQMTLRSDGAPGEIRPLLEGGLYFAGVVVVLLGVGAWLLERRDA